jgi:hypothetical protein
MNLQVLFENIEKVTSSRDIDRVYEKMKTHVKDLNREYAGLFKLNESVEFTCDGDTYKGKVESIGRTGRIKIELHGHWKYSQYTIGAARLSELVGKR